MSPWATPTYVTGRLVTHTDMNTLRDNLLELDLHNHGSSTGSGAGTAQIGPLLYMAIRDAAAPGSASGTHTRVFTTAGILAWVAGTPYLYGVATYGTPSVYYPSTVGGVYIAANATHTHAAL